MKTAVLFKTHLWNDTVAEAFRLCRNNARNSDIFIVCDVTYGDVDFPRWVIDGYRIFRTTWAQVGELGLEGPAGTNGGFWYNGDYQQNLFCMKYPDYDFICSLESDVGVYNNLDAIFRRMAEDCVDMVYYPIDAPNHPWTWLDGCRGYYDVEKHIHKGLFCISFFSRNAAFTILRRRLEMSAQRRRNNWEAWPLGEAVMANEIVLGGLRWQHLGHYCDHLDFYDWAPAYLPREFDENAIGATFVHSFSELDGKFVQKNFEFEYRALASERVVMSGEAVRRAAAINDFGVDCRLLHSTHMRWSEDRWLPLLNDALERLDSDARGVLGGMNVLRPERLRVNGVAGPASVARIVWPLPAWDVDHALLLGADDVLEIDLPDWLERAPSLVIGTWEKVFSGTVVCPALEAEWSFESRGSVSGMSFYGVALPETAIGQRLRVQVAPAVVQFLSVHEGQW